MITTRRSSLLFAVVVFLLPVSMTTGEEFDEPVVLVELFTSQGCSSCPPADRLLTRLGKDGAARVVPLAFHVDYWNYIGWTDPFSSSEWSARQQRYGRVLGAGRVYTPQLVVAGRADCVGSNESKVRAELEKALREPPGGRLELELRPREDAARLDLAITAEALRGDGEDWDVMVAVFENGLVTEVGRGENGGKTLRNSHVVHRLGKAFSVPARAGERRTGTFEIELDRGWRRQNLGVAVFLQDPESLAVHGAAVRGLGG